MSTVPRRKVFISVGRSHFARGLTIKAMLNYLQRKFGPVQKNIQVLNKFSFYRFFNQRDADKAVLSSPHFLNGSYFNIQYADMISRNQTGARPKQQQPLDPMQQQVQAPGNLGNQMLPVVQNQALPAVFQPLLPLNAPLNLQFGGPILPSYQFGTGGLQLQQPMVQQVLSNAPRQQVAQPIPNYLPLMSLQPPLAGPANIAGSHPQAGPPNMPPISFQPTLAGQQGPPNMQPAPAFLPPMNFQPGGPANMAQSNQSGPSNVQTALPLMNFQPAILVNPPKMAGSNNQAGNFSAQSAQNGIPAWHGQTGSYTQAGPSILVNPPKTVAVNNQQGVLNVARAGSGPQGNAQPIQIGSYWQAGPSGGNFGKP